MKYDSERSGELFGKDLGFFGKISGASPVAVIHGLLGFLQEGGYFRSQVGLGRIQAAPFCGSEIFLSDRDALVHLLLCRGEFLRRELRLQERCRRLVGRSRLGNGLNRNARAAGLSHDV